MGGPEGVHDIDVAQSGQPGGQGGVVLLFALEEADVLQQHHLTGRGLGGVQVGSQLHGAAQQAGKVGGHRRQGEFFLHHALGGTAQMRKQDHARALVQRHADAGQGRTDALVIGDAAVLHGHVEILADDNGLAAALHVLQQSDGHVCLLFVREGITGKGRDTASGLSKRYVPRGGKSSPAPKVSGNAVSGRSGGCRSAPEGEDGMRDAKRLFVPSAGPRQGTRPGILGAHVTPCPFCCRVAGISAAARPVHAPTICRPWTGRNKARDLGICHPAVPGHSFYARVREGSLREGPKATFLSPQRIISVPP